MGRKAHIEIEHWDGPQVERERVLNPSLPVLQKHLARLDGNQTDGLWIEIEGVGALTVGGGPDKFVVVSFPIDGSSSHVEADHAESESVELQVGGQTGVYLGAMVLSANTALEIATRFLSVGEYDQSLKWVRHCPPE